jgi:hypothetical protein
MVMLKWNDAGIKRMANDSADKMARRAALMIEKVAEKSMSEAKHGVQPPRPANRRSKAGEAPARQSGRLIGSVKVHKLREALYKVGSTEKYGLWLEFGTGPYIIRPKKGKFLRFRGSDGNWVTTTEVHHPGIKARPWLRPALAKVKSMKIFSNLTFKGPVR